MARPTAAAIAPPMVPLAICCISIRGGKTSDRPASASIPSWPTKCASTLAVTAIRMTFTTRLAGARRSSVATIGPSSSRRVRAEGRVATFTDASAMVRSHLGRPVVRLADQMTTPGVERVVHHQAMAQHLLVVLVDVAKAQGYREQAGRLRRQVEPRGIGAAHDLGELVEARRVELVLGEEGVEAALVADMAELHARDVIGNRAALFGDFQHIARRHVEKLRLLVDEAQDQPRAGDAVDLRPFTSDPFHVGSPCLSGSVGSPSARQAPSPPATVTASMPRSRRRAAQSPPISKPQAQYTSALL